MPAKRRCAMPGDLRPKIVVAEDDANIRELVLTRLQVAGYDAFGARDGGEAMRRTLSIRPAVLVLDINMPGMDGFGVLESLKSHRSMAKVLVLTARHAVADVQRAVGLGAKDYLAKPFSDAHLLSRVARLLRAPAAPRPPIFID
jgi:DNA-binding response OmpR family regulator